MKPIFEKVKERNEFAQIEFVSYDIEEDEDGIELVEKYNIKNIPTIVIVDGNNNPMKKIIGLVQEDELVKIIRDTTKYEL
jgi:thiol-disulfide isomerase/thioredoxin